jgi:hypothetical protein
MTRDKPFEPTPFGAAKWRRQAICNRQEEYRTMHGNRGITTVLFFLCAAIGVTRGNSQICISSKRLSASIVQVKAPLTLD